jgi:hypothetical protein
MTNGAGDQIQPLSFPIRTHLLSTSQLGCTWFFASHFRTPIFEESAEYPSQIFPDIRRQRSLLEAYHPDSDFFLAMREMYHFLFSPCLIGRVLLKAFLVS